mmetsp:Transcript_2919/g.8014  ORF Transcript_2919/g.8014 Transcript_2919/m.8014 type:complete len:250 (-) Transcript_2919:998-1747(-)
MKNHTIIAFAFNFVCFRSDAFILPTKRVDVLGRCSFLNFAKKYERETNVNKKRIQQPEEKPADQKHDAQNIQPQQQLQTVLAPLADYLDNASDGWALSYADLTPYSERSLPGQIFLFTNIAYTAVGLVLSSQGEVLLGVLTDICSIASFGYHYTQLQQPYGRAKNSTVRLALLIDYILAITSIFIGIFYLVFDQNLPPPEGIAVAILAIICLLSCWVWEQGLPYIILHGLWHIFSALSAYYIGMSHATS